MKTIIDLLGFRQEVEVDKSVVMRGEVYIPFRTPLLYDHANDILPDVTNDIKLRFEFMGYEDSVPLFMLDSRQLKQIYEALGVK